MIWGASIGRRLGLFCLRRAFRPGSPPFLPHIPVLTDESTEIFIGFKEGQSRRFSL